MNEPLLESVDARKLRHIHGFTILVFIDVVALMSLTVTSMAILSADNDDDDPDINRSIAVLDGYAAPALVASVVGAQCEL